MARIAIPETLSHAPMGSRGSAFFKNRAKRREIREKSIRG
jgi:hypothetical protein